MCSRLVRFVLATCTAAWVFSPPGYSHANETSSHVCPCGNFTPEATTTSLPPYFLLRRELRARPVIQEKMPPGGGVEKLPVDVVFAPIDILDVDDVRQVVIATATIIMSWQDPALSWNFTSQSPYANLSRVELPAGDVWKPIAVIVNGAGTDRAIKNFIPDEVWVDHDGTVTMTAAPLVAFTCKMDLYAYPFDTQKCRMTLYMVASFKVRAQVSRDHAANLRAVKTMFSVSAEWSLEDLIVEEMHMSKTDYLVYVWILKRKTTFYVISFVAPIVLTSYMNTVVFLIPVECGERISYLVTIFVSNAVFVSFCTNGMPQGLNETPLIMQLVLGIMTQSAVLIVINSLFLRRFHDNQRSPGNHQDTKPESRPRSFDQAKESSLSGGVLGFEREADNSRKPAKCQRRSFHANARMIDAIFFLISVVVNSLFVGWIVSSMRSE